MRNGSGAVVLCLSLAAVGGCIDPADRRPGLWLSGEVESGEVEDWSFSDAHPEIFIETRTPWWIPHSTTILCASGGDVLYVGAREPSGKRWVANVARDPEVRLGIGGRIYPGRLERIDEPDAIQRAYAAYAAKYGWSPNPPADAPEVWYWRVVPRSPRPGVGERETPASSS